MAESPLHDWTAPGWAIIVGTVDADGNPYATRAWGFRVADDDASTVVCYLDRGDADRFDPARGPAPIAVTTADVYTLRAVQLKGRVVELVASDDDDHARIAEYADSLTSAVSDADGRDKDVVARIVPDHFVRATIAVTERFDQTPGPTAGNPLTEAES